MSRYLVLYSATLIVLMVLDYLFLGVLAKGFFVSEVGDMLGEVKPVPATITRSASNYGKGILTWGVQTVGYLDPDLIRQAVHRAIA